MKKKKAFYNFDKFQKPDDLIRAVTLFFYSLEIHYCDGLIT
jgi:hypothetical protein